MIRITDSNIQPFEIKHTNAVRTIAPECTVLLKSNGLLPLAAPEKIAAYGSGVRKTIKGGTGSGDVNIRHLVTVEEGLEKAGFMITSKAWLDEYDRIIAASRIEFVNEIKEYARLNGLNPVLAALGRMMPAPEYDLPLEIHGNTAIYVLARNSGEGTDRQAVAGDIELSATEIRDILAINAAYPKFVLVLNVGGLVNLTPVAAVENILLLGQLGTPTGDVLADLLLGKSYPSGKLAMTWAPIREYPSTPGFGDPDDTVYQEGIYVGYRYFDTVGKAPDYPFGFGLGYTDFSVTVKDFSADTEQAAVTVLIGNTGTYAGKEVVQVYVTAPAGKLEMPYQELVGFAKSKELKPGEIDEITVKFTVKALAAYDPERACYCLAAGDYLIRVGNCSRQTVIGGILTINHEVITEQLKNICQNNDYPAPEPSPAPIPALSSSPDKDAAPPATPMTATMTTAMAAAVHITLDARRMVTRTVDYSPEPEPVADGGTADWRTVRDRRQSLSQFIGSLTEEQLARLCLGYYEEQSETVTAVGNAAVTIAGAAGETTAAFEQYHVPTLTMVDGPAGIRVSNQYRLVAGRPKPVTSPMTGMAEFLDAEALAKMAAMTPPAEKDALICYAYCVAIPIGTALAQSWNTEAVRLCGDIVGTEMAMFGVNFWLAPAMNIQRSPLCGRNFEYYSEDPLLSGLIGAAMTAGIQDHQGCAVAVKHFACNNQETNRYVSNSIVGERALREIYLKAFEICVRESQPHAIMSSYNLINGEHACSSKDVQTYVLRDEWGFRGLVMTDWLVTRSLLAESSGRQNKYPIASAAGCIKAGNDLVMPGGPTDLANIMRALADERHPYPLTKAELQVAAMRILEKILLLA